MNNFYNSLYDSVISFLDRRKDDELLVYSDFATLGSYSNLRTVLKRLCDIGKLKRVSCGVYMKNVNIAPDLKKLGDSLVRRSGHHSVFIKEEKKNKVLFLYFYTDAQSRSIKYNDKVTYVYRHSSEI